MVQPRQIETITVDDLNSHRWCYFHDPDEGFDVFEHVIPDTHPKFDHRVVELELAIFTFRGGEVRYGMYDGSKCFSVFINGKWFSLWLGVGEPSLVQIDAFRKVLSAESLGLPVRARARWTGTTEEYNGIRYYNENGDEVEANV